MHSFSGWMCLRHFVGHPDWSLALAITLAHNSDVKVIQWWREPYVTETCDFCFSVLASATNQSRCVYLATQVYIAICCSVMGELFTADLAVHAVLTGHVCTVYCPPPGCWQEGNCHRCILRSASGIHNYKWTRSFLFLSPAWSILHQRECILSVNNVQLSNMSFRVCLKH